MLYTKETSVSVVLGRVSNQNGRGCVKSGGSVFAWWWEW